MTLEQQKVFISQNTMCPVTGQPIGEKPFIRYPNGLVMLLPPSEVNLTVCGKTGRDFVKKPVLEPLGLEQPAPKK